MRTDLPVLISFYKRLIMKIKSISEITEFCQNYATPLGITVKEVEFKQGKNPTLTVYIDKVGGVDLDACELLHRAIFEPLDELDPTFGLPYTLNVSSLGIDRPFKTDEDFASHVGERIEVKLYSSIKGKKFFDGILNAFDEKTLILKVDDKTTLTIDRKNIVKANEYIEF